MLFRSVVLAARPVGKVGCENDWVLAGVIVKQSYASRGASHAEAFELAQAHGHGGVIEASEPHDLPGLDVDVPGEGLVSCKFDDDFENESSAGGEREKFRPRPEVSSNCEVHLARARLVQGFGDGSFVPIQRMIGAREFAFEQLAKAGLVDPARIGELGPGLWMIEALELAGEGDGILEA